MKKIVRVLVKRFWGVSAVLVISLAVLVQLGRFYAPNIDDHRLWLSQTLSQTLGVTVDIGQLSAQWPGLSPQLQIKNLRLHRQQQTIMAAGRANLQLDLLHSLLTWSLSWRKFELADVDLSFYQTAGGQWLLQGLPETTVSNDFKIDDPVDAFLRAEHIDLSGVRLGFNFRSGHQTKVTFPLVEMENSGDFHRLTSNVVVDGKKTLNLVIEGRGDPRDEENFSARGYLNLNQFDLAAVLAALPQAWSDRWLAENNDVFYDLNIQAWMEFSPEAGLLLRGRSDAGVREPLDNTPLTIDGITVPGNGQMDFAGQWSRAQGWSVALQNVDLRWKKFALPEFTLSVSSPRWDGPTRLQMQRLDIDDWLTTLSQTEVFAKPLQNTLARLQPRGQLHDISLTIPADKNWQNILLKTNINNLHIDSYGGAPAIENLNGYIELSPTAGFVDIAHDPADQQPLSLLFEKVYQQPFQISSARGRVHWQIDGENQAALIRGKNLSMISEHGAARGDFSVQVPLQKDAFIGTLAMTLSMRDGNVSSHRALVPVKTPESLREWLSNSLSAGVVSEGAFSFYGPLKQADPPSVQLYLSINDADVNFAPLWPTAKSLRGEFWLNNKTYSAQIHSGQILATDIQTAELESTPFADGGSVLNVSASLAGDARDGLTVLQGDAMRDVFGNQLDQWRITGAMNATLQLTLPLGIPKDEAGLTPVPPTQQIEVALAGATLSLDSAKLEAEDLSGELRFDSTEGLFAEKINGRLFNQPMGLTMDTRRGVTKVVVSGSAEQTALQAWLPRPEWNFLQGQLPFAAEIVFGNNRSPSLTVNSNFKGMAVNLPAPYGKATANETPFQLRGNLGGDRPLFDATYGDEISAKFELGKGGLSNMAIGIGTKPELKPRAQVHLAGNLGSVDIEEWQTLVPIYQQKVAGLENQSTSGLRFNFDLKFEQLVYKDLTLEDFSVGGSRRSQHWLLQPNSESIAGVIDWYDDDEIPISIKFEKLHLPANEDLAQESSTATTPVDDVRDPMANIDPATLPPMDINVNSFAIGEENYGSVSLQLRRIDRGVELREFKADSRGGLVRGIDSEGAVVIWQHQISGITTSFKGRFLADNLLDVTNAWQQPRFMETESFAANADVSWPGSPAAMSLQRLSGEVQLKARKGRFFEVAKGASASNAFLQLVSFLNFDTWVRRLRLDFKGLGSSGLKFDDLDGVMEFSNGLVEMEKPLVVQGTSSKFQLAGNIDLQSNELDTKLVATLPVRDNLTFYTAIAAGLPAAAGVWVVGQIFKDEVEKVASVSFEVKGNLNDPKLKFDRLFDDKVAK